MKTQKLFLLAFSVALLGAQSVEVRANVSCGHEVKSADDAKACLTEILTKPGDVQKFLLFHNKKRFGKMDECESKSHGTSYFSASESLDFSKAKLHSCRVSSHSKAKYQCNLNNLSKGCFVEGPAAKGKISTSGLAVVDRKGNLVTIYPFKPYGFKS